MSTLQPRFTVFYYLIEVSRNRPYFRNDKLAKVSGVAETVNLVLVDAEIIAGVIEARIEVISLEAKHFSQL